jgi:hypothetical protein
MSVFCCSFGNILTIQSDRSGHATQKSVLIGFGLRFVLLVRASVLSERWKEKITKTVMEQSLC